MHKNRRQLIRSGLSHDAFQQWRDSAFSWSVARSRSALTKISSQKVNTEDPQPVAKIHQNAPKRMLNFNTQGPPWPSTGALSTSRGLGREGRGRGKKGPGVGMKTDNNRGRKKREKGEGKVGEETRAHVWEGGNKKGRDGIYPLDEIIDIKLLSKYSNRL